MVCDHYELLSGDVTPMNLRSAVISFALVCTATAALAADNTNNFVLMRDGKPVGKAYYSIDKNKGGGYHGKAHFNYKLAASVSLNNSTSADSSRGNVITEGEITYDYKVDDAGNFLSGYFQNGVTQTITSLQMDKARTAVTIGENQAGVSASKSLGMPGADYGVMPDYDPSSVQLFLTTALAHPHADGKYTLIIPGLSGRGGTGYVYVAFKPEASDASGTLDGKPIALKHYTVQYLKGHADLYTDADGNLMEADMETGTLTANYVRVKFALPVK